jgi:hypothetical protein
MGVRGMTKYKQAVQEMLMKHQKEFEEFGKVHDVYKLDQGKWQDEFNRIGKPILRIIQETENRLCGKMENSSLGKYSNNLADKFREEIRKIYPYWEMIGVKVE